MEIPVLILAIAQPMQIGRGANQVQALGVRWTDAAVIAAVVSGVFVLVKEFLSFLFRLLEQRRDLQRGRRAIYARVAQDYFRMGYGAMGVLAAWAQLEKGLNPAWPKFDPAGIRSLDMRPLNMMRLDEGLMTDVAQLAAESPETVMAYLNAANLRNAACQAAEDEQREFGEAPGYSYPRTRNFLRGILEGAVKSLGDLAVHLPDAPWWQPWQLNKSVRHTYAAQAAIFQKALELLKPPRFEPSEVILQEEAARQSREQLRKQVKELLGEDATNKQRLEERLERFPREYRAAILRILAG